MARPLRIEYSNAWYHVMNRGLRHEDIFFKPDDRLSFLSLLDDIHKNYHVQVHAYCLMNNHYHLMLHTPFPNLQRAMRHLGGVFTQRMNRTYERDGPLFRGRYKAKLIETETYLMRLSRYIHFNPVAANMVKTPEEYQWSSCRSYLKLSNTPSWLYCDETLSHFGEINSIQSIKNYQSFLGEGIDHDLFEKMSSIRSCPILGSDKFIESIAKILKNEDIHEITEKKPLINLLRPSLTTIQNLTCDYFKVDPVEITKLSHKPRNITRQLAIYLAAQHTDHSHQVIANYFGNTSRYGVSKAYRRLKISLSKDENIRKIIREIEQVL